MHNNQNTYITEIIDLDKKGSGHAVVRPEPGEHVPKKIKLTIPETLPGEQIRLSLEPPLRRRMNVRAEDIVEAHPERIEPSCPHFSRCGGCAWQHWDYGGQLQAKTDYVKRVLQEQGFDPNLVHDIIPMDNPWRYRNKMEFTFGKDGSLGLHEQGNFRKIISLETCLIASEEMVEGAMEIADWAKSHQLTGYDKDHHSGLLRHLMVRQSFATGEMMLALFATEGPDGELADAAHDLTARITTKFPHVKSLLWMENRDWADRTQAEKTHVLAGRDFIYDEMLGYRYRLWFDTFFQTNPTQAQKLVELALDMAKPAKTEKMIDLFCGVGTFSLPFADRTGQLAGIEIVETSIDSAKRNAQDNGVSNTYFLAKDARHGIDEVLEKFVTPELLVLDPPRSGAGGKVMRRIGRAQPKRVVYVSCNPDSLAIDLKQLEPFGYELVEVQPVDLFPHTVHVECVALMSREL